MKLSTRVIAGIAALSLLTSTTAVAAPAPVPASEPVAAPEERAPSSFEFDLLGDQASSVPALRDPALDRDISIRRTMLQIHQGAGFALLALMAATVVLGQLNYSDRFAGPGSGRFELTHSILAYTTTGAFAGTGLLAIFAPTPFAKEGQGFDRLMLHRIGMYGAAAMMVAQIILGIVTTGREGFNSQRDLATAHLVLGYTTLASMTLGVGALVF